MKTPKKKEITTGQCPYTISMAKFMHEVITDLHGSFNSIRNLAAMDFVLAVRSGTLFPDLGREPMQWHFEEKVSAIFLDPRNGEAVEEIVSVPAELPRDFRQLARAHGMTESQASHALVSWRVLHRSWWVMSPVLRRKCR